jgi:glyoxylate reductase
MPTRKVFVTYAIPDRGIELLRSKGYAVDVHQREEALPKAELIRMLQGKSYEGILCLLTDRVDAEVLDAAGNSLKILANYAVGFDNIDLEAAAARKVLVTNTPDVLNESVAELTFALMLTISRRIVEADKFMRRGDYRGWKPTLLLGDDIAGKTLGVLGVGRIGSIVVRHAVRGFGMKVIYFDPRRNEEFEKEFGATHKATAEEVLREADFISIHVPLLPVTRHLIDRAKLRMMKRTAYLINTSRGPIVDEHALAEALRDKVIKGAAIDVFENEPNMDPLLRELDNVIVTPHIASATEETRQAMGEIAAKNIIAALEGEVPPNLVRIDLKKQQR